MNASLKKNLPNEAVDILTSNKLVDLAATGASPHFRSVTNKMFNLSCIIYNLQRLSYTYTELLLEVYMDLTNPFSHFLLNLFFSIWVTSLKDFFVRLRQ